MHSQPNQLRLYSGKTFTGVTVVPDAQWPGMYRVHWPDRPPSVMVNLTRAKDAAMRWVGRVGGEQGKGLNWKTTERRAVAPPMRLNGDPLLQSHPEVARAVARRRQRALRELAKR